MNVLRTLFLGRFSYGFVVGVCAEFILLSSKTYAHQPSAAFRYDTLSPSDLYLVVGCIVGVLVGAILLCRVLAHSTKNEKNKPEEKYDSIADIAIIPDINHHAILDAIPGTAYVCVYNTTTHTMRYTYMSNRADELLGISADEFVNGNRRISERIESEFIDVIRSQAEECTASLSRFDVTFPYHHTNGSLRWIQAVATPTRLSDTEVQWSGYMSDITPMIQHEQRSMEYEHTLVNITNAVPGVVYQFVLGSDGTSSWFPFISKAIKDFSGVEQDEWIENSWLFSTLIHPADYPIVQQSIRESSATLEQWHCEFRMFRRDTGALVWVSAQSIPERLADGGTMWYGVLTDITQQKTNEERAESSKQLLLEAQKIACMGSWECNLDTEQMAWTAQMFEIFQRSSEIGVPLFTDFIATYFHPSSHDDIHDSIQLAIQQHGGRFEHDVRAITDKGSNLHLHFVCQVICRSGESTMLIGTVMDISERKSVEDKLRDANTVIEKGTSVLFRWAIAEGGIWNLMFVSGNIEQWGYSAEEILADPNVLGSIVYKSDLHHITNVNARNRERRIANYSLEYRIVARSGERRWVEEQVFYQFNSTGMPITCDSIVTDITARKEAELSLSQHVEELKMRDHLLDTITSTLQQIVISTDAETTVGESLGHIALALDADRMFVIETASIETENDTVDLDTIHWYNPQFEFKATRMAEVSVYRIGMDSVIRQLREGHPIQQPLEDYSPVTQRILRAIQVQSQLMLPIFLQNTFWGFIALQNCREPRVWRDHEVNILLGAATTIAGAIERSRTQRKVIEYAEFLEDAKTRLEHQATELLETNYKVEVAREQAETANRAKSAFLSSMSHELRTPLNAILGFTQIMLRDTTLSDSYRKHLNTMQRSGEHLLGMINDILDISKIEAGRLELQTTPMCISDMLDDVRDMFSMRCSEKNLDLDIHINSSVPNFIEADLTRLRQIIINLVGNSVKFTPHYGTVSIMVDYAGLTTNNTGTQLARIHFGVRDTGRGIPSEQLLTIFEPFRQVNGMHSEGTGLGLAICSRLVGMMGGMLKVESTLGKGSTFWFETEFPVITTQPLSEKEVRLPVTGIRNPRNRCILVVDDIQSNRDVIIGMLGAFGFEFVEAVNGAEALAALQSGCTPDIILMDLLMPIMTGEDAMRNIRNNPAWKAIPIIAITASGFDGKREKLIDSGFNDYIRKPFDEEDLFRALEVHTDCEFIRDSAQQYSSIPSSVQSPMKSVAAIIESLPQHITTPLVEAIEMQDFDTVRDMLANMDIADESHRTAFSYLHSAASNHDFKLFVELSSILQRH